MFLLFNAKISAESPSFTLQQFTDDSNDFIGDCFVNYSKILETIYGLPDIRSVSYISDGKSINASLWFEDTQPSSSIVFENVASLEIGKINSSKFNNDIGLLYSTFTKLDLNGGFIAKPLQQINYIYNNNNISTFDYTFKDSSDKWRYAKTFWLNDHGIHYYLKYSVPPALYSIYDDKIDKIVSSLELND